MIIIIIQYSSNNNNNNRQKDRRLSAKLVPTFADRGMSRVQGDGSIRPYSRFSGPKPLLHEFRQLGRLARSQSL
jgi:hypothetical protein